ncbi:aminoglycoside N(3)-acetyltransferase [Actinomadura kijaniata]|uniref:aminoglycoside N(3)-acetyltransferase n=1 Tax=Actinomadura kijaniata TaxID=46161 RepID=UPI0028B05A42|nr:AAC(3) family N-acetyltransferase [Actinomadura namibiensis]
MARDLRLLGVRRGGDLLVHASLRNLGRPEGGPAAVLAALGDVLGPDGTVVVYTATPDNSDTSRVHLRRVRGMSEGERERHLRSMPAFDPARTPSSGMGALAEHVRTSPGARRSEHPQSSFAALGPRALHYVDGHAPDCHLGESSPLAKLYKAEAHILLLGVGYDSCTALHLAEYRYTPDPPMRRYRCVVERDGGPAWWSYEDVVLDDGDFPEVGAGLDRLPWVRRGRVGHADTRLIPVDRAVDFAVAWFAARRTR